MHGHAGEVLGGCFRFPARRPLPIAWGGGWALLHNGPTIRGGDPPVPFPRPAFEADPALRQPFQSLFKSGRRWWRPLWDAGWLWLREDCVDLSAAFAYHTLQSFFPALLIILSVFSRFLGRNEQLSLHILNQVAQILPPANMPAFELILERFTRQGLGAGLLGVLLLILSANNIYLTLQRGTDRLWLGRPSVMQMLPWHQLLGRFVRLRLKAFGLLLLAAFLLLADQLFSNLRIFGFKLLHEWAVAVLPVPLHGIASLSSGADFLYSFFTAFLVSLIYLWLLPSRPIHPRVLVVPSLLVGGAILVLNVLLGRVLIALGMRFQAYGVVGGVLTLTLWIWLVGIVLYYGQCLGIVLSRSFSGGRSVPPQRAAL
jgi:membrane protein